jgi:hypothetical protein
MNAATATMAIERAVRLGRARSIVATPETPPSDNAGDADSLRARNGGAATGVTNIMRHMRYGKRRNGTGQKEVNV